MNTGHDETTMESQTDSCGTNGAEQPWVRLLGSNYLTEWMASQNVSFGFTTYQTGKLFLVGTKQDQKLSVFERTDVRTLPRPVRKRGRSDRVDEFAVSALAAGTHTAADRHVAVELGGPAGGAGLGRAGL